MTRRGDKIDANQPAVVEALELDGCLVTSTAGAKDGFPDLFVTKARRQGGRSMWLMEVKDGTTLTPKQKQFHVKHHGAAIHVVNSPADALLIVRSDPLCR